MDRQQSELIEHEVVVTNDIPEVETHHALRAEPTAMETVATPSDSFTGPAEVQPVLTGTTPDAIRSDIERTRAQMDNTIDLLSSRLKPRHLVDDVLRIFQSGEDADEGAARRTIREAGVHAAAKLKQNPVPATLIGAGLAWLLFQDKSRRSRPAVTSYDPYMDTPNMEAPEAASSLTAAARQRASSIADSVSQKADTVATKSTDAGNAVADMLESAPLAFGVGALAAGLVSGLVIPATRTEEKLMGEASREVKDTLADAANTLRRETIGTNAYAARTTGKADRMWDR
jgi:hypothetical protein